MSITTKTGNSILDRLISNMVFIEGGSFRMGEQFGSYHAKKHVEPIHQVTLSNFYIGKFQVRQSEWKEIMGYNHSQFIGDQNPIERVSWDECNEFISKLTKLTQLKFSFPTEAQWEFAAKGGKHSKKYLYSGSNQLYDVGWCYYNSGEAREVLISKGSWFEKPKTRSEIINNRTHPVGSLYGNELDIYDMSGNVDEWCLDWHAPYSVGSQNNPLGPSFGECKVYRGGNWRGDFSLCETIRRNKLPPHGTDPTLGLRLALNI